MNRPLRWVADTLGIEMKTAAQVTGWSTDTRTVAPGDLFFALRGPNFDGNQYVSQALEKGAVAAIADGVPAGDRVLQVPDSLGALQTLAAKARQEWAGEVVGVTGSAGKTSTKEMVADMISTKLPTERTQGNLNNHIGLPLTLLRLDEAARVAVLEMGMNHAGEIRALCEIAKPNVGVVTNVGWAHIENFESRDGIASAKRELVEALGPRGVAVLNADDDRVAAFANSHPGRTILYGQSAEAELRADDVQYALDGVRFRAGARLRVRLLAAVRVLQWASVGSAGLAAGHRRRPGGPGARRRPEARSCHTDPRTTGAAGGPGCRPDLA